MEHDNNFDVVMGLGKVWYVGHLFQGFGGLFSLQLVVLVVVAGPLPLWRDRWTILAGEVRLPCNSRNV